MVTGTLDDARYGAAMDSLYNVMVGQGKDISTLLKDEQLRLTKTIINFTPPTPASGARKLGENAVRRDLEGLIQEAREDLVDEIGSKYGTRNIDAPFRTKTGEEKRLVWENLTVDPGRLPELHNQYRKKNGRPRKMRNVKGQWRAFVVVPHGLREPYIKENESHVGRWKAKWAFAAAQPPLSNKFPNWISKHFGYVAKHAVAKIDLASTTHPSITFGGAGPDFRRNFNQIQGAIRFRTKAIVKHIRLLIRKYDEQLAKQMRAETAAHMAYGKDAEETVT